MTLNPGIHTALPAGRHGSRDTLRNSWRDSWRGLVVRFRSLDILAATTAASLPWSTTMPAILIVLWLVILIPTIDWDAFADNLARPACALPVAFVALATLGVL